MLPPDLREFYLCSKFTPNVLHNVHGEKVVSELDGEKV